MRIPEKIEEVKILGLSGNLSKDSKKLAKIDKVEHLQKEIGLPKGPEKPREKPAEVKKVLTNALFGNVNIQAIYDLVSGKSRRQKRWYQYEDMQDDITWIRKQIDDDYFQKTEIPAERISEFLELSCIIKPEIRAYVKAKNIYKVMLKLEDVIPIYIERLKESKKEQTLETLIK